MELVGGGHLRTKCLEFEAGDYIIDLSGAALDSHNCFNGWWLGSSL